MTDIQNNYENTIINLKKKLDKMTEILYLLVDSNHKSFDEVEDQLKISKKPLNSRAENNRIEFYPESKVEKKSVPIDKIKWSESYSEYYPNEYTSENVLYNLSADIELLNK